MQESEIVILITGCSSGIGRSLALEFQKRSNCYVYASSRKFTDVEELGAQYTNMGTIQLDVTNPDSRKAAIDTILKEKGKIDVLINNAGYALFGPVTELDEEQLVQQYQTNVFGAVALGMILYVILYGLFCAFTSLPITVFFAGWVLS